MRRLVGMIAGLGLALGAVDVASAGMAPDPRPGDTNLGKSNGISYVSDPDFAAAAMSLEGGAACPDAPGKWRVVGGGFALSGGADSTQRIPSSSPADLLDLYGDDDLLRDDFWRIGAVVSIGTTLTTYATCAKWDGIKQKAVEVPDSPTGERKHVAKCGSGKKVTGGGGIIGSSDSYVSSMFPKGPKRWSFRAFDGVGGPGGMTNFLVCVPGQDVIINKVTGDAPPGDTTDVVVASCPADRSVVGGGAKSSGAPGTLSLRASQPHDGGDADAIPDDGWSVRAFSTDPGVQELRAYAICAA